MKYILRRLALAAATILGVMVVTFVLFRCVPKDIAAAVMGNEATEQQKATWRHIHGYDKPLSVQFVGHLYDTVTFNGQSLTDGRKLTDIIRQKAPYSLAITVPAMAIEFALAMSLACVLAWHHSWPRTRQPPGARRSGQNVFCQKSLVAYYRGSLIDKAGVFLCVLGMCVPFLAFMIYGQRLVFWLWPRHAYGLFYRSNLILPIAISVTAGLGGMVRFYRTIILEQTGLDYVRTARAKGLAPSTVLFKHVIKNCMPAVLQGVVASIPHLIMGNLLLETFLGIPGLGDLMITSITNANEPVINGVVFLSAAAITLGTLLADIAQGMFDPRIRLS
jgi:peptide/nickel transport system permease protein